MDLRSTKSKQEPQSLVCYEHVRQKCTWELASGTLITEQGLANELGISRTPAREALRRLESDGLVNIRTTVRNEGKVLGYTEILELYEAREALEMAAVEICATKIDSIEISELVVLQSEMSGAVNDPARLAILNCAFHKALLNAAKNRYLTMSFESIQNTLHPRPTTLTNSERAEESLNRR